MVLNKDGESIYLRKSATGTESASYTFLGTFSFSQGEIKKLNSKKANPIYYVLYHSEDGDYLYGKITGPDLSKAETILEQVSSIKKSVYVYEDKKNQVKHYKILPKGQSVKGINEKEQRQLRILQIFLKTIHITAFVFSIPLILVAVFFQLELGILGLTGLFAFLYSRIHSILPSKKESTMATYD